MSPEPQKNKSGLENSDTFSEAQTGNASNPSPQSNELESPGEQLLNHNAEKYLREVASIEDVPDAQDQQEMEEVIKKETSQDPGKSDSE